MKMFSLFDTAVKTWSAPIFVVHPAYAQRFMETLANDPTSDVGRFPSQFCLFEMGEFDENTGEFSILAAPVSLGLGTQFIKPLEVENAS